MEGRVLPRLGASQPLGQTHQHTHPLTPAQPAQHLHLRSHTEVSAVVLLWKHAGSDTWCARCPQGRYYFRSSHAVHHGKDRNPLSSQYNKVPPCHTSTETLLFMVKLLLLITCITGSPHHGNGNSKALLQFFSKN